jgi:15-cis-phytoene synthase
VTRLLRRTAPTTARDRLDRVAAASAAQVISGYSTSFGWATRLLAEPDRTHVRVVYALVRVADEIVDEVDPTWSRQERAEALDRLHAEVGEAIRTGRGGGNLVVHAFATTARRYGIGPELVDPFFDSMRADLDVAVHDAASLARYVHGSAEVVGLMCLRVFVGGPGVDSGDADVAYSRLHDGAVRLGAAFQKVNFLRDLAADHDGLGRTYLLGSDPTALTDARRDELCDDIDADLAAAAVAIGRLPARSRRAVAAAHGLFAELNARLRTTPAATLATTRVRVPDVVKARIVARAVLTGGRP